MKTFKRVVELVVVSEGQDKVAKEAWETERRFTGLFFSFEVDRNDGSSSDKATIKVANLSAYSRSFVEARARRVRLSAGYNDNPGLLFSGSIVRSFNERQGPDIITTLECSDGGDEMRSARIDCTFNPGVTDMALLEFALTVLGEKGVGRGRIEKPAPQQLTRGYAYSGPIRDMLDELCQRRDLIWRIENGVVEVLPKARSADETGAVLSPETGLVGYPSKKSGLLVAKALLNPRLSPTRIFRLQCRQSKLNGMYVVNKAKFSGDTGEGEFVVEIEGQYVKR